MAEQYALSGNAAELYERNMVPAIFQPLAEDLLAHAALQEGEAVLDVACGTGIVSRLVWSRVAPSGRVAAVDLNAQMLAVGRRKAAGQGASIEWIESDAAAIPLPDAGFDVVTCQCGLQYFPDPSAGLAEMRRLLKPGGRLAANVLRAITFNPGHKAVAEALARHVSQKAAATRRAPFTLSQREDIRALLIRAGFTQPVITLSTKVTRFPSAEGMIKMMMAGTPLAAEMADADPGLTGRVIDDVAAELADYEDDLGLALPMQAWVMTARN